MNKRIIWFLVFTLVFTGCTATSNNIETGGAATSTMDTNITETAFAASEVLESATIAPTEAATATAAATATEVVVIPPPAAAIEDIIEYEMKGSFDFFWEQANTKADSPGYGLVRDRYPGNAGIASMASVGYALTAYVIGVEKGYITREEGYERVNRTFDTLAKMKRVDGFYYHFVDMETTERAWSSEVSTIDSSILFMGVLTAGDYFGGEVQAKAQKLYDEVNWPSFIDESRDMFYMAYRPEKGKGYEGHWDFYAEQLMLYVLAAGSDTYPIDDSPYYTFIRHSKKYGDGKPFIHSWFGSIFTYQYSHAWIDFRGYTDKEGANWFDNSVEASLAQVQFAIDNDEKYLTLGPDAWGLSACDGPKGYNGLYGAPPSGYDNKQHLVDDTIPPSGAIGSIIFVPEQAKQAMLNYYSFEKLKGKYGFQDAYNLTEDWFASDVIGIDKGVTLLMLANYQNDIVYQIVMKNKNILKGLERLQIKKSG